MADTTVERALFAEVMTAFPTGVTVVTTIEARGEPVGLTSNAVSSVSADPPMLLVCVAKTSRTLPALLENGGYLVNFMAAGSEGICAAFASKAPSSEKFAGVRWRSTPSGRPYLYADTVAYADCELEDEIVAGSHVILVGRVIDAGVSLPARAPLAYFRRAYGIWAA